MFGYKLKAKFHIFYCDSAGCEGSCIEYVSLCSAYSKIRRNNWPSGKNKAVQISETLDEGMKGVTKISEACVHRFVCRVDVIQPLGGVWAEQ